MDRLDAGRRACAVLLTLVIAASAGGSCRAPQPAWTENDGGTTRWIDVAAGRLKTRVYTGVRISESPVLVLVLHGDIPDPPPSYQYEFAKVVADTLESSSRVDIVAAGVLRPGYADPTGERSSGDMGRAIADNYTPEVVDAVERAARQLSADHHPRAVVLVGHSGGAAIAANLLGQHPDVARAAVLAGCGCDPDAWRARRLAATGNPMFAGPTRSLQPLALVNRVAPGTLVRLVVGDQDDVTPPADSQAYATALRARDVDAPVNIVPGLGHNILFAPAVRDALRDVVTRLGELPPH